MSLLILFIYCVILFSVITRREAAQTRCHERERIALLQFKNGFVDDYGVLSSWSRSSQDCCLWRGVGCSNRSNHVVTLDLHGYWSHDLYTAVGLSGAIDSSLLELKHLKHLDLSYNRFTLIPKFIGSLRNLRYLNLSNIYLEVSKIPPQLGNLSYLQTLDLSNSISNLKNTEWLYQLTLLQHLSLTNIDLSESNNMLFDVITRFPLLSVLQLGNCFLRKMLASSLLPTTNFTKSLYTLDISENYLPSASIYPWLFNSSESLTNIDLSRNMLLGTFPKAFSELRSLQNLYLTDNGLTGGIPRSFGNCSNLRSLHLDVNNLKVDLPNFFEILAPAKKSIQVLKLISNKISGSLPDFTSFTALRELHINDNEIKGSFPEKFEQTSNLFILNLADNQMSGLLPDLSALSSLRELYLERNRFEGTLAERIMPLSELQSLGVSSNHLHGTISENHLTNLSNLVYLDLSYNSFVLEIDTDWSPAFSLDVMSLSSCKLGPSFPTWLRTQKNFSMLDISNAKINDFVPDWFWKQLMPNLRYLNLSSNQIHGTLPDSMYGYRPYFDFSTNNFSGPAPLFPSDTQVLVLNNNFFSGSISFLQNLTETFNIDLSNNQFFGEIPDFWMNFMNLMYLNLKNNSFEGRIPKSMRSLSLYMLSMSSNNLTGELHFSLTNWSSLQFLDLGGNKLSGRIPAWIGRNLSELRFLSLSSNAFHGTMPPSLCRLSNLQILDISSNNISGTIPKCLNSLKAMTEIKTLTLMVTNNVGMNRVPMLPVPLFRYVFKAILEWKGVKHEYSNTLGLVTCLDLSSNRFNGEIPGEITNLLGLVALNLSRNNLTWKIPHDIGRLRRLDFIDMSRNHLTGGIPSSLALLTNLGVLDLSNNNLSGRIPTSTQLQSFDNSSYIGNPSLCGLPLSIPCPGDLLPQNPRNTAQTDDVEDQDKLITRGFFISLLIGLAFGFWGVCGTLVVSTSWRCAYISFLSHVKDWIYVIIAVNCAKLKRRVLA